MALNSEEEAAASKASNGQPVEHYGGLDCDDLEDRFLKKMQEFSEVEQKLFEDYASWQRVCVVTSAGSMCAEVSHKLFESWVSTTAYHENERAYKRQVMRTKPESNAHCSIRLKTQIAFLQEKEQNLETKKEHRIL